MKYGSHNGGSINKVNTNSKKNRKTESFGGGNGSVQSGLASRDTGGFTPASLGMANKGKNQVPTGPAKHKANKSPFKFC